MRVFLLYFEVIYEDIRFKIVFELFGNDVVFKGFTVRCFKTIILVTCTILMRYFQLVIETVCNISIYNN